MKQVLISITPSLGYLLNVQQRQHNMVNKSTDIIILIIIKTYGTFLFAIHEQK